MKKILLVAGILMFGTLSFSDVKSDYENAVKVFSENGDASLLDRLTDKTGAENIRYKEQAALQLASYYVSNNFFENSKKYLEIVKNSFTLSSNDRLAAVERLYEIYEGEGNQIKARTNIELLNQLTKYSNINYISELVMFYFDNNLIKEATNVYNKVMYSNISKEAKGTFNYYLGNYFLNIKKDTEKAKKYLEKAYKLSSDGTVYVGEVIAQLYINNNKIKKAETKLFDMDKRTGGNNTRANELLGNFYLQNLNYEKAEKYYEKLVKINSSNIEYKVILLGVYELNKNEAKITNLYNELKKYFNSGELNRALGVEFAKYRNYELSEKYLLKAIVEDRDRVAILNLAELYAQTGKKNEAIVVLEEAIKGNLPGAKELFEVIKNIK